MATRYCSPRSAATDILIENEAKPLTRRRHGRDEQRDGATDVVVPVDLGEARGIRRDHARVPLHFAFMTPMLDGERDGGAITRRPELIAYHEARHRSLLANRD